MSLSAMRIIFFNSFLLSTPIKLVAIERDRRCIDALTEIQTHYPKLEIIEADALAINELELFQNKFAIIANLPYNIATVLLFKWLKIYQNISSIHIMLQKEVAQRIAAKQGDNHYGRLAIMVNILCETKIVMTVKNSVFTPPPKVTSAIIRLIPRPKPLFDVVSSACAALERFTDTVVYLCTLPHSAQRPSTTQTNLT